MGGYTKEGRTSPRFLHQCSVDYMTMGDCLRRPNRVPAKGGIMDLSSGGMKMQTGDHSHGFAEGAILKVWLPIPMIEVAIPVLTEVRWVKEEMPGIFQAGLKFFL